MSDKAVSSGDGCDPYSDDEDCYEEGSNNNNKNSYDDQEGSGSGDPSNDLVPSTSGGKHKDKSGNGKQPQDEVDEEEGEEEENWPPWVTAKPEKKDIVVVDPKDKEAPKVKSGADATVHFAKSMLYYLVPVFTCFLGSLVSW